MTSLKPFDVIDWVARNLPSPADWKPSDRTSPSSSVLSGNPKSSNAVDRAKSWLAEVEPAIEGTGNGRGQNHTFFVCCTLIHGFRLTIDESLSILPAWNQTCQPRWNDNDLMRKLEDASKSKPDKPIGWMLTDGMQTLADLLSREFDPEEPESTPHSNIIDDPASIAIRFIQINTRKEGICLYQYYDESFYFFDGEKFSVLQKEEMEARLFWFIDQTYYEKYMDDLNECPEDQIEKVKKKRVSKKIIAEVTTGLVGRISVNSAGKTDPFWVNEPVKDWEPYEVIPFNHRLVHIPSFVNGERVWFSGKTPKYFTTYSLPYRFDYRSYDGEVDPPPVWAKFLNEVFGDDEDSIRCLREWMGYLMTPSTKQQKLLMLIGPPRCGKGTIIRTIQHMVGARNCVATTFASLTGDHGLEPLINKTVATIADARVTHKTDVGVVVERLLSITGEDDQPVNPKGKRILSKRLLTRFIVSSNELPRLSESSGAIVNRAVILSFKNNFAKNPDTKLENKLMPEIPSILRWAIDGWKSLNERGYFIQPESAQEIKSEFANLSSGHRKFIEECIEIGDEFETNSKELYDMFILHSRYHGSKYDLDMSGFLQKLRSALPCIEIGDPMVHNGDGVAWARLIRGVRINASSAVTHALEIEDESPDPPVPF